MTYTVQILLPVGTKTISSSFLHEAVHHTNAMAEKQLIVAVEGTAAMGPFWQSIVSDYLDKIIR